MKLIDDFLNNITMYRLVLYFLIILAVIGLIYSVTGVLPFSVVDYIFSFTFVLIVSWISNKVFAYIYEAPTNVESVWISALILGLIITPVKTIGEVIFLGWAATLAMAGKYIFAIGKKHIFNPVAISIFLTAVFINGSATWWVGATSMLPVVAIGSFLIIRKIKRWDLVLSFLGTALLVTVIGSIVVGKSPVDSLVKSFSVLPLVFFAGIMLTEPLTTPPTRSLRIWYGAIVGMLISPQFHLGSFYTTPEIALIIGNVFSYFVSPKDKLILKLNKKIQLAPDIYDFIFIPNKIINFKPGQYMEWTLAHRKPDSRGNRRYLSLASSPTESEVRVGIKFGTPPSTYKRSLYNLSMGQGIIASQLAGDFTFPKNTNEKLVFVAGGIGVTPFRSMIKYLIDRNEKRDIVILYSAKSEKDFVYKEVFSEAEQKLGIRIFYSVGRFDPDFISSNIPDYRGRSFYLSGPRSMVDGFIEVLRRDGVGGSQIKTDYFPGFA